MKNLPAMGAEFKEYEEERAWKIRKEQLRQEHDREERWAYFLKLMNAACDSIGSYQEWARQRSGETLRCDDFDYQSFIEAMSAANLLDNCRRHVLEVHQYYAQNRKTPQLTTSPESVGRYAKIAIDANTPSASSRDDSSRGSWGDREPSSRPDSDHQHVPDSIRGPAMGQLRGGHF